MKIAIFHHTPFGGAFRHMAKVAKHLAKRHQVTIFTTYDEPNLPQPTSPEVKTISIPTPPIKTPRPLKRLPLLSNLTSLIDLVRYRRSEKRIARTVEKEGFNLLLAFPHWGTQAPQILTLCKLPKIYYCLEPHRRLYEAPLFGMETPLSFKKRLSKMINIPYNFIRKRLDYKGVTCADLVIANSYHTAEGVIKTYGIIPQVASPGVDLTAFTPPKNPPKEHSYLLSVGALTAQKGHWFALKAVGALPKELKFPLHIVANLDLEGWGERLRKMAQKLDVELVIRINLNDRQLCDAYAGAEVVLCCQVVEPFGLVPLEALAVGRPVLAVREGGFRETLEDCKGALLADRHLPTFSKELAKLLKDPRRMVQMGEHGRRFVERHWGWERSVAHLETIIDEFMSEGGRESWKGS